MIELQISAITKNNIVLIIVNNFVKKKLQVFHSMLCDSTTVTTYNKQMVLRSDQSSPWGWRSERRNM